SAAAAADCALRAGSVGLGPARPPWRGAGPDEYPFALDGIASSCPTPAYSGAWSDGGLCGQSSGAQGGPGPRLARTGPLGPVRRRGAARLASLPSNGVPHGVGCQGSCRGRRLRLLSASTLPGNRNEPRVTVEVYASEPPTRLAGGARQQLSERLLRPAQDG